MASEPADSEKGGVREEPNIHVELTHAHLSAQTIIDRVKSPKAGAVVLFAGTTRDTFASKPVSQLVYQSYVPLALTTLLSIAREVKSKHDLTAVSIVHRLGEVPIGEESILIAVSAPHRQAAWRGGEEALEETKKRAEVWKLEEFVGEKGVWRANRDGAVGEKVDETGEGNRQSS
ncbi:MoaE-domain-containing protein [Pseudovirgaria hyperparasitica]|uniref:Molybdopterin synthase catalytic subunit n=1 Tax=Pseudovirgaria hyperparasitica TaxID=470096 RepID=A0A6A6W8B8_9PEZI|nr:MoaE-domain-containing protein [Pseudovirgaria hyperparasitica]KAF2757321.1 MoaE-domain-containing protein [Pseudovirgaria hyperparasitica]